MNKESLWLAMALVIIFLAGCAGEPVKYRQQETFYSPYGGSAIVVGAAGATGRDGTIEKGFVSIHPFNEGQIVTLVDEEEVIEDNPNLDPKCNNYKGQLKRKVKKIYRHQVIMQGQVVYAWNDNNPNWWAVGLTNLAGRLIDRGVDAAFLATMPTGNVNIAGGSVGNINQQQKQGLKSVSKNTNVLKNKNTTTVNTEVKSDSSSSSGSTAIIKK